MSLNRLKTAETTEVGYHYSDINPEVVYKMGLSKTKEARKYSTELTSNAEKYLPKNHIYICKEKYFSEYINDSKYIYKIDTTSLIKYPDFGTFPSTGAYMDEESMWWKTPEEIGIEGLKYKVALNDGEIAYSDVTGCETWDWFGTCVVQGPIPIWRIIGAEKM
jgi:hypothetical protein